MSAQSLADGLAKAKSVYADNSCSILASLAVAFGGNDIDYRKARRLMRSGIGFSVNNLADREQVLRAFDHALKLAEGQS